MMRRMTSLLLSILMMLNLVTVAPLAVEQQTLDGTGELASDTATLTVVPREATRSSTEEDIYVTFDVDLETPEDGLAAFSFRLDPDEGMELATTPKLDDNDVFYYEYTTRTDTGMVQKYDDSTYYFSGSGDGGIFGHVTVLTIVAHITAGCDAGEYTLGIVTEGEDKDVFTAGNGNGDQLQRVVCCVPVTLIACEHKEIRYCSDSDYHWTVCDNCGLTSEKEYHDFSSWTDSGVVCTECGYVCRTDPQLIKPENSQWCGVYGGRGTLAGKVANIRIVPSTVQAVASENGDAFVTYRVSVEAPQGESIPAFSFRFASETGIELAKSPESDTNGIFYYYYATRTSTGMTLRYDPDTGYFSGTGTGGLAGTVQVLEIVARMTSSDSPTSYCLKVAGGDEAVVVGQKDGDRYSTLVTSDYVTVTRSHDHDEDLPWSSDTNSHWKLCSCGYKEEFGDHEMVKKNGRMVCADCGYVDSFSESNDIEGTPTNYYAGSGSLTNEYVRLTVRPEKTVISADSVGSKVFVKYIVTINAPASATDIKAFSFRLQPGEGMELAESEKSDNNQFYYEVGEGVTGARYNPQTGYFSITGSSISGQMQVLEIVAAFTAGSNAVHSALSIASGRNEFVAGNSSGAMCTRSVYITPVEIEAVGQHTHKTAAHDENTHWYECECGHRESANPHSFKVDLEKVTATCNCGYAKDISIVVSVAEAEYTGTAVRPAVTVCCDGKVLSGTTDYTLEWSSNTNAGENTACVYVVGKENYSGRFEQKFTISKHSMTADMVGSISAQSYTGEEVKPAVTVKYNGITLTSDDYTVEYGSNTDAGTATVTVKGQRNFTGEITRTFTINKCNIANVNVEISPATYTGTALEPAVTVTYNGNPLSGTTDYTLEWSNNTKAGTAKVTVVARPDSNFTGSKSLSFFIAPCPMSEVTIGGINGASYTGAAQKPTPNLTYAGKTLVLGTDYTVEYYNNVYISSSDAPARVHIEGKGNFTGSRDISFSINALPITEDMLSAIAAVTYTGEALQPEVKVTMNSGKVTLRNGMDYIVEYGNNINAGENTAVATVTGIGNYSGTAVGRFTIKAKALDAKLVTYEGNHTYTGLAIQPVPTVTDLSSGTDYTVSWSGNIDTTNKAVMTITGKGNYTGTVTKNFTIKAKPLTAAILVVESPAVYDGTKKEPAVIVTDGGRELVAGTDYTVAYSNNTAACERTAPKAPAVTVTGKGNYTGKITGTFTITPADITTAVVTTPTDQTYSGKEFKPTVTVKFNGKNLSANKDYSLAYASNTDAGTAYVTIIGMGNFSGETEVQFAISRKSFDKVTIAKVSDNQLRGILPVLTVKDGNLELVEGRDYTAALTAILDGKTTVKITGIGNYSGDKESNAFTVRDSISGVVVKNVPTCTDYTGKAITFNDVELWIENPIATKLDASFYTYKYLNNTNAGTASIVFTGRNGYIGEVTELFEILPRKLEAGDAVITKGIAPQTYTGKALTPALSVTVTYNGSTKLALKKDYQLVYASNTDAGTATVSVVGMGNYAGTPTRTNFTINAKDINKCKFGTIPVQSLVNDPLTPEVIVTDGVTLTSGTDYRVTYRDNDAAGKGVAVVEGIGNYTGTKTLTFQINKSLAHSDIKVDSIAAVSYTGSALKPAEKVNDDTTELKSGTHYTVIYADNVNAGTAAVIIVGKGSYAGTKQVAFTISKKPLGASDVAFTVVNEKNLIYTGAELQPAVTAKFGRLTMKEGVDFTIASYTDNIAAGTKTATIYVIAGENSNYEGSGVVTFTIQPKALNDKTMLTAIPVQEYTGSAVTPGATLNDGTILLGEDTDYTVTYSNNTNLGTAKVTIVGKGNYKGTINTTFAIRKTLTEEMVPEISSQYYTGKAITPKVTVSLNGNALTNKDYAVTYQNNTNAGTAHVTVTGKGNYAGAINRTFEIQKIALTGDAVASIKPQTYSGKELTPALTVKCGGKTLKLGQDFVATYTDNRNAGEATVTVGGINGYTGTASQTFIINPKTLTAKMISAIPNQCQEVEGTAITPELTIMDGVDILLSGADYTVEYDDNEAPTTAKVKAKAIVSGTGNYTTKNNKGIDVPITVQFTIVGKGIYDAEIILDPVVMDYTGKALKPAVTVLLNGVKLTTKDYKITYASNTNAGTAFVIIDGIGAYGGRQTATFEIRPWILNETTTSVTVKNPTYSGLEQKPALTVKYGKTTLKLNSNYAVEYGNNVNAGTAVATITGINGYEGQIVKEFTILQKDISRFAVTGVPKSVNYTGSRTDLPLVVKDGKMTLSSETDYWVSYANEVAPGKATVYLDGVGNYTGTITKTYTVQGLMTDATITDVAPAVFMGKGKAVTTEITVQLLNENGEPDTVLTKNVDYTVKYTNNTAVADSTAAKAPTVTITGKGAYKGSISQTFTITEKALNTDDFTMTVAKQTYTGKSLTPVVTLKYNNVTLNAKTDYIVLSSYTDAGTYDVAITVKDGSGYTGTATFTDVFVIQPKAITKAKFANMPDEEFTPLTAGCTPDVGITDGVRLVSNTDYTLTYQLNDRLGSGKVIVTGIGNYNGSKTVTFKIVRRNLRNALEQEDLIFYGNSVTAVKVDGMTLVPGQDYTCLYKTVLGNHYVVVTGCGKYTGAKMLEIV